MDYLVEATIADVQAQKSMWRVLVSNQDHGSTLTYAAANAASSFDAMLIFSSTFVSSTWNHNAVLNLAGYIV